MARVVIGVSGASGIILAYRATEVLAQLGHDIDFVMSPSAVYTATLEMGKKFSSAKKLIENLSKECQKRITIHGFQDVGSAICSGSYQTDGMILLPCSMSTLAALAVGLSDNTLRRAADVTLKERRTLIIVPREAPLGEIHLENMLKLTKRGAIILPPSPAWYLLPKSVAEIENTIIAKALDLLKIEHTLSARWS